jgi:hypothetical protein
MASFTHTTFTARLLFYRLGEVERMPISARASGKVFDLSTPALQTDRMELVGSNRLPPSETGMIVDKGMDFPPEMDAALRAYGEDMWFFRDQSPAGTTRAVNRYQGDHRGCVPLFFLFSCFFAPSRQLIAYRVFLCVCPFGPRKSFQYLTPRLRITPRDLLGTCLSHPATIHFICSPSRAAVIMSQVAEVEAWSPISVYEPIPVCMTPPLPHQCIIALFRRSRCLSRTQTVHF